jgi:hypothetical protein
LVENKNKIEMLLHARVTEGKRDHPVSQQNASFIFITSLFLVSYEVMNIKLAFC